MSIHRRDFLKATALGVAAEALTARGLAAATPSPAAQETDAPRRSFPKGFWWGAATAAYQLEGAAATDGRKPSIWDTFSKTPGKVRNGDTGDVACDHYHLFKDDVKLMAELGVKHYRFSTSWSRVIPDGRGAVNEKGLDFYSRLVDELLANGITPHCTLYHWDLPQALQDRYRGWQSREVIDDFASYASLMARRLGDRVTHWMTLNEIRTFAQLGYFVKSAAPHAPGLSVETEKERWQVSHHALLAHGKGCQAIRAASPRKCSVGIAENFNPFMPVIETAEHIEATRLAFNRDSANGAIIVPLLTGQYDPFWMQQRGANAPTIQSGDMETIHQPLDALGFNCYTGAYVRAAATPAGYEEVPMFDKYPKMGTPWLNYAPESIYWGIRMVRDAYGQRNLPIFISENGCADSGPTPATSEIQDIDRVMYLRSYLSQVKRALTEGHKIVGYFPWSLLDNFEWADGYATRFGMVHVDYTTQKRTPKLSYRWYQQVVRTGEVV
jgi:beta-glucosidase